MPNSSICTWPRFRGYARNRKVYIVDEDGTETFLNPFQSQSIWLHSPDGFNWGYGGGAPSQLALAVLQEVSDNETGVFFHQYFRREVIEELEVADDFEIPVIEIVYWILNQQDENERYVHWSHIDSKYQYLLE